VRTIRDWNHLENDIVDDPSTEVFRERLANIHPDYLHNLISVQSTGRTRSSSLVTLAQLPYIFLIRPTNHQPLFHTCITLPVESAAFFIVNLIVFTLLVVDFILRISPHFSHHLRSHPVTLSSLDLSLQT